MPESKITQCLIPNGVEHPVEQAHSHGQSEGGPYCYAAPYEYQHDPYGYLH
jgi:hypothetical protein